jgi:hypothetical protein
MFDKNISLKHKKNFFPRQAGLCCSRDDFWLNGNDSA